MFPAAELMRLNLLLKTQKDYRASQQTTSNYDKPHARKMNTPPDFLKNEVHQVNVTSTPPPTPYLVQKTAAYKTLVSFYIWDFPFSQSGPRSFVTTDLVFPAIQSFKFNIRVIVYSFCPPTKPTGAPAIPPSVEAIVRTCPLLFHFLSIGFELFTWHLGFFK